MTNNTLTILGIETSCDETAAAVIRAEEGNERVELIASELATSLSLHAQTGGIIPEVAAREQLKYILPVIDTVLNKAQMTVAAIDAIAVTYGPGLIGSLLVGVETAKTLSYVWHKPLIPVNHLYGHIYANWINLSNKREAINDKANDQGLMSKDIQFPALALVVSGGHTDLVLMKQHGDLQVIGGTRDDAAGEAFDKIGRLLGLPYPAGPIISKLAENGNPKSFTLPRPMIGSHDFDFSFSGLKTAVLNLVKKDDALQSFILRTKSEESQRNRHLELVSGSQENILADLCASVEEAIIDTLVRKTLKAAEHYNVRSIILGGGVAANEKLGRTLRQRAQNQSFTATIYIPPKSLCTDNAAMIAAAAFYNRKITPWQEVTADPELYF